MTALGRAAGLDADGVADLRLAVDEACTAVIQALLPESTLEIAVSTREDVVRVNISAPWVGGDVLASGTFSRQVIEAVTQGFGTTHQGAHPGGGGGLLVVTMMVSRLPPGQ